jgi:hypothetical protein
MLKGTLSIFRKMRYSMATPVCVSLRLWWQVCPYLCLPYMNYYRLCFSHIYGCRNVSIAYLLWDQMRGTMGPPFDLFEREGRSGGVFYGSIRHVKC